MQAPLVSVLMLTYNHQPYIRRAIEHILMQQTTFPFELVIGEDCSTDGTREIVFDYAARYPNTIRLITSDKNVGAKKNLHRVYKACLGKYTAFCEGDDYWHHRHKLQQQADYLEAHCECGLVYSSYDVYHVKTDKTICDFLRHRKWELPANPRLADFLEGPCTVGILTCTIMIRHDLYRQVVEADPYLHQGDHFLMGDTQVWAEISTKAKLHRIPESLATHIITEESITRSRDIKKRLRFMISSAELCLYLCEKYNLPSSTREKHRSNWCRYSLELAFHARDFRLADEVRRRKTRFTWKDWFRYYGAQSSAVHLGYRLAYKVRALFAQQSREWM